MNLRSISLLLILITSTIYGQQLHGYYKSSILKKNIVEEISSYEKITQYLNYYRTFTSWRSLIQKVGGKGIVALQKDLKKIASGEKLSYRSAKALKDINDFVTLYLAGKISPTIAKLIDLTEPLGILNLELQKRQSTKRLVYKKLKKMHSIHVKHKSINRQKSAHAYQMTKRTILTFSYNSGEKKVFKIVEWIQASAFLGESRIAVEPTSSELISPWIPSIGEILESEGIHINTVFKIIEKGG